MPDSLRGREIVVAGGAGGIGAAVTGRVNVVSRFFLEPDNYVTGQVLSVDGGITL